MVIPARTLLLLADRGRAVQHSLSGFLWEQIERASKLNVHPVGEYHQELNDRNGSEVIIRLIYSGIQPGTSESGQLMTYTDD